MKNILLFTILLLPQSQCLHAQQTERPKNQQSPGQWFGIFAGLNFNYLDYHDEVTTIGGTNISVHAGISFQSNIGKCFAVQPELVFSVRGGKIRDIDSTVNARLINVELPINFLWLYKHLIIGAGPSVAYGLSGKLNSNGTHKNAYDDAESLERTLKRFEIGANFVIGYLIKKKIMIKSNFSPGFTNIYKGDGSAPRAVKAHTRTFGFSLGYRFGIRK